MSATAGSRGRARLAAGANAVKAWARGYVRDQPDLYRFTRLALRGYRARVGGYPDWQKILAPERGRWEAARAAARSGPKILIATSTGGYLPGAIVESLLAAALTLRGADVHVLLCDRQLSACQESDVHWYPNVQKFAEHGPSKDLCRDCFWPASRMYESLGLKVHRYGDYLTPEDRRAAAEIAARVGPDELADFEHDGVAVGEQAMAGALRFFARATLDGEPHAAAVARRYLRAALTTAAVARKLMRAEEWQRAVFHHGIYVPQGVIGEVARQEKVPVVNWNTAYRKQRFIFSHGDSYHRTMLDEPSSAWEGMEWSESREDELLDYLKSRWTGQQDWIRFHDGAQFDVGAIAGAIGLDPKKPTVGMLTNVMWDARLHYRARAFPSMLDWVLETVRYFATRPDLQLVIRVHPGELGSMPVSRQPVVEEIERAFPGMPPNVFIIPPSSPISTYAAMSLCDSVLIYGTKTGVELSAAGTPVLVAGEAWIRGKGITRDASSREEYLELLRSLPLRRALDEDAVQRARRYAYHFFFRRMIPLEMVAPVRGYPLLRLDVAGLDDIQPGRSAGLDVICDGILAGREFVYQG